ncbi:p115 like vesicle tethering protein [Mrakia frigida]|uniref:p115 like vesicle tethering protein n=1 Tax=Mrakia frigida TaxID=29902 RepID=UPI003FCBF9F4
MNLDLFSRSLLSNASSVYTALQGNLGATQTAQDTIRKLVVKIDESQAGEAVTVEERRASLLSLKALGRDWKEDVALQAFPSLLTILQRDAPNDVETAKATLETLIILCETDLIEEEGQPKPPPLAKGQQDLGILHTDVFLSTPEPLHALLSILSVQHFYVRFYTLQLLSTLLQNRPAKVQDYVLTSPGGVRYVMECLEERREILRNEALLLLHNLTVTNADLQKIVAFEGAFEKLLDIVFQEGGIEGGIVVQDCLAAVGTLLRFNSSNQNYFREISQIPRLPPLLLFPSPPPSSTEAAPDEFSLQYWPEQKITNAGLVLGLVKLLVAGGSPAGNQNAMLASGMTRCLLEMAMASNAPPILKAQALSSLTPLLRSSPPNQSFLSNLLVAPLVPLPPDDPESTTDQGVGYTRLTARPATVSLVGLAVHGEEPGSAQGWSGVGLKVRKAAVGVFESYVVGGGTVGRDAAEGIVGTMKAPPGGNPNDPEDDGESDSNLVSSSIASRRVPPPSFSEIPQTAGSLLLSALTDYPSSGPSYDPYRPLFASLLFAHLLRISETTKKIAREITFPSPSSLSSSSDEPDEEDDDDGPTGLVQVVVGNLMMAAREQSEAANREAKEGGVGGGEAERERRAMKGKDWTRAMVGWLEVLAVWMWDSPKTVKEFLSEGANLQVLIAPITQSSGLDPLIQGLSAFLLGVCYEFNREPGEITRSTLHPILHGRIGPDQFVSRMARLREDPRFKAVGPEMMMMEGGEEGGEEEERRLEGGFEGGREEREEVWFDWSFVEFWKNNYYTIQRSINADPDLSTRPADADSESAHLITSLRTRVKSQSEELEDLQAKLAAMKKENDLRFEELRKENEEKVERGKKELEAGRVEFEEERSALTEEISSLTLSVSTLTSSLSTAQAKHSEDEKEQEDLLVLLEELSQKRKKDKSRLKEAGLEVSEEEGGDEDEDEDEEEEDEEEDGEEEDGEVKEGKEEKEKEEEEKS